MLVMKLCILLTSTFYRGTNLTRNTNSNWVNPVEFAVLSINNLLGIQLSKETCFNNYCL